MRLAVATVVKNEVAVIAEWLAHHAAMGFERFLVYDNGSTDGTQDVVRRASAELEIELHQWDRRGADYQTSAYEDAARRMEGRVDWLALLDADELLTAPSARLSDVLEGLERFSGVAVNWLMYGSGGRELRATGLMGETYLMRSREDFGPNRHVKLIVRPGAVRRVENAHYAEIDGVYADALGHEVEWKTRGSKAVTGTDVLRVNHYFVRSLEEWKVKLRRGYNDGDRDPAEYGRHDRNDVYDPVLEPEGMELRRRFAFLEADHPGVVQRQVKSIPQGWTAAGYLAQNPDIAAAGWDAEAHWLYFGCREHRAWAPGVPAQAPVVDVYGRLVAAEPALESAQ